MKIRNKVLQCLIQAHTEKWSIGSNVSDQTCKSQSVTEKWQDKVIAINDKRYRKEYVVSSSNKISYKIDIVDMELKIAYELKVSPKNPHHEFYKDIFKIALANKDELKFKKLYFCVQEAGRKQLGMLSEFAETESKKLGFDVEIFYF